MDVLNSIIVDTQVIVGSSVLPIRQILALSRGATVPLDCGPDDPSPLQFNGTIVAYGLVEVEKERMRLTVTELSAPSVGTATA